MAETQGIKSKRDKMSERLRSKYPDREYADDEAMFGQISDDYDEYDKELGEYRDRESKLSDMFTMDPRSASLLMGMRDGEDPAVGLMRRFGPELKDILDDPTRQEELAKAQAEYLERITKEKDLESEYNRNLEASVKMLEQYQAERGLSDEEVDGLLSEVIAVANDMVVGKFTPETLDKFARAKSYDKDVAAASEEGEVKGRNARIEEKLRKPQPTDGQPVLAGANNAASRRQRGSIFDLASQA